MAQRELATEYVVALCGRLMGPVFTTRMFIAVFTAAFTQRSLQHRRNTATPTSKLETRKVILVFNPMPYTLLCYLAQNPICLLPKPLTPTPYPMHAVRSRRTPENEARKKYQREAASCSRKSSSSYVMPLMRFFVNSNAVKKIALTTHDRDMDTPRPGRVSGWRLQVTV
jgi:hypothetical protein